MDSLLAISKRDTAKHVWKSLGIPVPLPQALRRSPDAWPTAPLASRRVLVATASGRLNEILADDIVGMGADVSLMDDADAEPWRTQAARYGSPLRVGAAEDLQPDALVLDATNIRTLDGLDRLYETFHPWVARMRANGRCIVLGREPRENGSPVAHATYSAMMGFVRSLAKEMGRFGTTAHFISTPQAAEERLRPVLRFALSDHASFITGQPWRLNALCGKPDDIPLVAPLTGKVALVTGAARGIGAAIATSLAREGAHVVCLDRPSEEDALSALAQRLGGEVLAMDITDSDAPTRLAAHFSQVHGRVDVVVHNAGVTRDKTLARMDETKWSQALDVNLRAVAECTEALSKCIADQGRVVVLSSVAGLAGNVGQTNYSASKAGLLGYVSALAQKLASRRIAVAAVAPGFIETQMTLAVPFFTREAGRRLSALNQGGVPEDVAELVTFLSSPGAYGFSGHVVRVCGGMLLGA